MNRALVLSFLVIAAASLAPAAGSVGTCSPAAMRICLQDSRFGVEVAWTIPGGVSGYGYASPLTDDTGLFWFFSDSNLELVVKVLDGRAINGHFWVYYGGLSDVEYTITVTDTQTDSTEIYHNPASQLASAADTSAFAAEPPAAVVAAATAAGTSATAATAATAAVEAISAVPLRQGPELRANVTTEGFQWHPDVAIGSDGGSMVVWSGRPSDLSSATDEDQDVYGRFFDAAGNPRGGEIRLNDSRAGVQSLPRVAAAPGGGYMVVWQDGTQVVGHVYGVGGQPLGHQIKLSRSLGFQSSPDVVAADGGFVAAWQEDAWNAFGAPIGIAGQRFNLQGGSVGNEFEISGSSFFARQTGEPRLASLPAGGFLATWLEGNYPGRIVTAQIFDAGTHFSGPEIMVGIMASFSSSPGLYQEVAAPVVYADGSFSVLWGSTPPPHSGAEALFARRFSARGLALGSATELRRGLSSQTPAAIPLPSGDTLVLWSEAGRPLDFDGGVLARSFDSSWTPRGPEIRINSYIQEAQREPAIAGDASGRLLAVWSSGSDVTEGPNFVDFSQDGSNLGVFGQRFTLATCALTSDQLCLDGRFRVDIRFTNPLSGETGTGHAVPLTSDTGAFWFFGEDNVELMLKVLDGRAINGHFWFYAGALSDVAYTITVTDTETGAVKTYTNHQGHLASRADVEAF